MKYNIPKLTAKQFEYIMGLLISDVMSGFTPVQGARPGASWMDADLPVIMECLGYGIKVTKSMIQGVSAKPAPAVAIIDFILDLAS